MPDDELLALAVSEEFVFVTNNHADFMGLCANAELHTGLVVLPQRPRDAQLPLFSDAIAQHTAPRQPRSRSPERLDAQPRSRSRRAIRRGPGHADPGRLIRTSRPLPLVGLACRSSAEPGASSPPDQHDVF
jgi:hypothetical protein